MHVLAPAGHPSAASHLHYRRLETKFTPDVDGWEHRQLSWPSHQALLAASVELCVQFGHALAWLPTVTLLTHAFLHLLHEAKKLLEKYYQTS